MRCYDRTHIAHTTVTTLDIPTVEQIVVPMVSRKVFVHQLKESAGNVCRNILVEWGVKPDYISAALPFAGSCGVGRLRWGGVVSALL